MILNGSVPRPLRCALLLSATFALSTASAMAQNPSTTPPASTPATNPSTIPAPSAIPAPVRADPSTLQSLPAADPDQKTPATPAAAPTPYVDPLEQPIVMRPAGSLPAPSPVVINGATAASLPTLPAYDLDFGVVAQKPDYLGSTYIPVDSPVYPMAMRLYSLGWLDTVFINMRPWTRRVLLHAIKQTTPDVMASDDDQAQQILARLLDILSTETPGKGLERGRVYGANEVYTRVMGITGTPLRDSFHIGQTIANDYGRPYANGFNNVTGVSSINEWGRFSLFVRGEYQHAPASAGYSLALATQLSNVDLIYNFVPPNNPQATIPYGKYVLEQNPFRLQEATLSFHVLGHEISGGKSDAWLGPGMGGAFAWTNNAEDIYSFRINRVEPLHVPYLSALLGPLRYDFFVGSLKGHTYPNDPWIHAEMFSFAPTANFQFGFQRSVIWGGKGHEPVTIHTFLQSFFSINDTTATEKYSTSDPGARFSAFNFSWRLPFIHRSATFYVDTIAHDDVTPPSAPRRAAYRPGIYISQIPHFHKLDFRAEAATTDPPVARSNGGQFNYVETIQLQGYTNKGFIMGDWIGREAKGGQAWITYHLSADEWIQGEYLNKKTPKDFIAGGTTQNQFKLDVVKRLPYGILMDAWFQYEGWKAPIYLPGLQKDNVIAATFTWYPGLHSSPVKVK